MFTKHQDDPENSLTRQDLITSSSSLSFGGAESSGSSKRPSLKGSNNVICKIKDRTGIPV